MTVPFSVALVAVMLVAVPVVAVGGWAPPPGETVRTAATVDAPRSAAIVAVCVEVGVVVVMVKFTLLCLEAIITDGGTRTLELSDESVISTPPLGAGLDRVTAPVTELPPTTEAVLRVRLCNVGVVTAVCTTKLAGLD
jgi:hypothetical protein